MSSVIFIESNVQIDLTGRDHFRFSDCPGYQSLNGSGLKEMDVGWMEASSSTGGAGKLYLLELKNFGLETLTGRGGHRYPNYAAKAEFIISELVRKSIDSVCMLMAVAASTTYAAQIAPCLPASYGPRTPIQLVHILHFSPSLLPYLPFINDEVKSRFRPYQKLFDIVSCTVISHAQAVSIFPNIQ